MSDHWFLGTLAALVVLLVLWTAPAFPQFAVIDVDNIAQTTISAEQSILTVEQMLLQVANSNFEVQAMALNLLPALGQSAYPLRGYEGLLRQMSEMAFIRPHGGRNLDYFQQDIQQAIRTLYPGVVPTNRYPIDYGRSAETVLNTTESLAGQVHVSAGQQGDDQYDTIHNALYQRNEQAEGELAALHTGNAVQLSTADGVRRVEKSNGTIASLIATRNMHDIQKEAWGEAVVQQWLDSVGNTTPKYTPGKWSGLTYHGGVEE